MGLFNGWADDPYTGVGMYLHSCIGNEFGSGKLVRESSATQERHSKFESIVMGQRRTSHIEHVLGL